MHSPILFLTTFVLGFSLVLPQENVQTRIPDSLLECYKNVTLNHREFRPPMTINTFIELVRKVEQYPGSNMDIRALTVTLLHRFRLDGIEQNTEVMTSSGVIPFAVKGYQFFKHRILMRSFLPGSQDRFQNESLSAIEQCTMHFMLSNSIDKGKRGDEGSVCNQIQSYRSRPPRSVEDTKAPTGPDADVELINVKNLSEPASEKDNMFLDDDADRWRPATSTRPRPTRRSPAPLVPRQASAYNPRATATQADTSECPVENGAVLTPYGTLTLGTLMAGIAAGLQPLSVSSQTLNPKIQGGVEVENIWAATLAGDLAELVLLQGPKYNSNMKLGPVGGWNSTILPRWYFIKESLDNQMTDAEMRGGLDGLIIGKNVDEWNRRSGNRLKLSQVLDMYYSERGVLGDARYRACARRDRFADVASRETLEEQTDGFATILDPQMINEAYLDEDKIMELSREAANRLTNYIPSNLDSASCTAGRVLTGSATNVVSTVEVYVVLDTSWQFDGMRPLLMEMMTQLEVGMFGGNLTVIAGKDQRAILNGTSSMIDFTTNFTQAIYSQSVYGMDLPGALRSLRNVFKYQLEEEKRNSVAGSASKVVVFIPPVGHSLGDEDMKLCRDHVQYFQEYLPDVKMTFLTQGNKDRYQDLVEDPTKDIFELRGITDAASIAATLEPLVSRLKQVHHRVINPVCGSTWVSKSYSSGVYTAFIEPSKIAYHRLHPNYLYAAGWGKLKVQGFGYGNIKVCYSRRSEYPGNSTSGSDTKCKEINSDTLDISFDKPCDGYDFVSQCPPYYISVEAATVDTPRCFENGCRFPDSIKYAVINEGLTCTAGIGRFVGSPGLIAVFSLLSIVLTTLTSK